MGNEMGNTDSLKIESLKDLLVRASCLIEAQSKFIERYRTSGKCPQPDAVLAVSLLHERNALMPNHYNKGLIAAALKETP